MGFLESLMAILIRGESVHGTEFEHLTRGHDLEFSTDFMPRNYVSCRSGGYDILLDDDGGIDTAFIYVRPLHDFEPFRGDLLFGIQRSFTRTQVRQELGKPKLGGKSEKGSILGWFEWDRFDFDLVGLHVQYSGENLVVERLAIMLTETAG